MVRRREGRRGRRVECEEDGEWVGEGGASGGGRVGGVALRKKTSLA